MTVATPRMRKLAALGDPELMTAVGAGRADAFGELYDRYCDRAYRVARAVCRDDGRAQDAVQDAFLSVWRTRAIYQSQRGPVAAWLLTTVRYRAIDLMRVNGKHLARRADEDRLEAQPAAGDIADRVIHEDETDRLKGALAMLPDAQQEVITLAYYGQLSHTEIATHLGLPPGTVKGRMRLGLQKLHDTIRSSDDAGKPPDCGCGPPNGLFSPGSSSRALGPVTYDDNPAMADHQAAVRDALSRLDAAFAQHDLGAVVDLCTDDVVFIGSGEGEEAVGRGGIEAMFAAIADRAGGTEFALRWQSVSVEILGDLAILSAIGESTLSSPRRQAVTRYRLTGVLVREADRWLWRVHHGSEPAAW